MEIKMKFGKKIYLFLVIIGLSLCSLGLVFAEESTTLDGSKPSFLNNSENTANSGSGSGNNKVKASKSFFRFCSGIHSSETDKKVVALTFDDGPHKIYTQEILAVLKKYNIKATFFLIGKNVEDYPKIVREIYAAGHIIGNHTYSHYAATRLSNDALESELTKAGEIIYDEIKRTPVLYRPPYGACTAKSAQLVKKLGFTTIMWSDAVDDCHAYRTTPAKIATEIIRLARPGAIIALHDGGGNREKTVKALPMIIEALSKEGYEFLTIPELLGVEAYVPEPKAEVAPAPVASPVVVPPAVSSNNNIIPMAPPVAPVVAPTPLPVNQVQQPSPNL